MNRTLVGALGALMLVAAGVFWWQGHAAVQRTPAVAAMPSAAPSEAGEDDSLPTSDGDGLQGPALPHASEATREQRRFDRFDKDRDGRITRAEMLAPAPRISASWTPMATTCSVSTNGPSAPTTSSRLPTPTAMVR
jgi:hypothetical protein